MKSIRTEALSNEFSGDAKRRNPVSASEDTRGQSRSPELTNIVKTAIRIIAGSRPGEVARAAKIIGISEPTLYRWRRVGNMAEARGTELLRVYELTGLPVELLIRG
jgi:transcriptional regulator of acetoin/glycerol metabolism